MTPAEFNNIRTSLGLTKTRLGRMLRVSWRSVHRWEIGERPIPGPVALVMESGGWVKEILRLAETAGK